jgi:hypothetical protein
MRYTTLTRPAIALAALALSVASGRALAQTSQTSPEKLVQAKMHMEAGAAFYNDPNGHKCEEAYREFSKAYELSGSLNALKAMGVCALELERDGDAIAHFEKFLAGKGSQIDAADKAQVESDLKALRAGVAWVTLKTDRPGARVTDVRTPSRGSPISNRYTVGPEGLRVGLHPGAHIFTASADSSPDVMWRVELTNGGTYEHTFELPQAQAQPALPPGGTGPLQDEPVAPPAESEMERPMPTAVYVFGGLTVALVVPMTIFMIKASGDRKDYDEKNDGSVTGPEIEDLRSTVQTSNLLADVFLGATAASLVTTGILFLTRPSKPAQQTGSWTFAPTVGPSGGGAFVTGRF